MAFFNYVDPWPETTHWPLRCSAPGDGMPPCGRADFGRSGNFVWTVWRHVLRIHMHVPHNVPLDRLPARFREGRSGWPKTQF
jgi:hypothetical protein